MFSFGSLKADELTAGKLRDICGLDKLTCKTMIIGLMEGLKIGSIVGSVGTSKNIVGKDKFPRVSK